MAILLTGGCGYIGSHAALALMQEGYDAVIADDLSNSSERVIDRLETLAGRRPTFYNIDVCRADALRRVFEEHKIEAVMHFAGCKCVPESVKLPLKYYRNNLDSTLTVLEVMRDYGCRSFIFSSSATVYGDAQPPFSEETQGGKIANPYGRSKRMIEEILTDAASADGTLSVVLLRYFNPIGAHPSGLIGEQPDGVPNNLMPYLTQTAIGQRSHLNLYGTDYPTPDGTCIRDYIHVWDLAMGHVRALEYARGHLGTEIFNLGTGRGYSVREVIAAFERAWGKTLPVAEAPRRPGDIPVCYALVEKAERVLGWHAEKTLDEMCADAWNWQRRNPHGYE